MFCPADANASTEQSAAAATSAELDLGVEQQAAGPTSTVPCEIPPNMTTEAFSTKYPEITCTITLNLGQPITCHYVDQKVFITSSAKFMLPGYASSSPKPIFLYAGGTWISDSSKVGRPIFWLFNRCVSCWGLKCWNCIGSGEQAKDFLSKETNVNKAVEFRLDGPDAWVSQ